MANLAKVVELQDKINRMMSQYERSETLIELVDVPDMQICFSDGTQNVDVSGILNTAQMQNIKSIIIASIKSNQSDAEDWLKKLCDFNPNETVKKFADGSDDNDDNKIMPDEMVKKEVRYMLQNGYTQKKISETIGMAPSTLSDFIKRHNLKQSTPSEKRK